MDSLFKNHIAATIFQDLKTIGKVKNEHKLHRKELDLRGALALF